MLQPGGCADMEDVTIQAVQTLTCCIEASEAAEQAVLAAGGGRVLARLLWEALECPAGCSWWPAVAHAIVTLGRQSNNSAAALAAHGAVEALVQLLPRPGTWAWRPAVLRVSALAALACGCQAHIAAMVEAGAVPALVRCLNHSEPAVQGDMRRCC